MKNGDSSKTIPGSRPGDTHNLDNYVRVFSIFSSIGNVVEVVRHPEYAEKRSALKETKKGGRIVATATSLLFCSFQESTLQKQASNTES